MIETCRLCGSPRLRAWMTDGRNRDLVYYRCDACTLWNYDLESGVDQSRYTAVYVSPRDADRATDPRVRKDRRLHEATWRCIERHAPAPGSIMDIGCGSAGLLHLAREAGWQVRGMELTQDIADKVWADQRIEVVVGDFLEYDGRDGEQYDVVVLRHVLEHLPDSILAMHRIGGLLKEGGIALLEFPNTASMSYTVKRILKNRGLKNRKHAADWRPGHVNEFCRTSFEYLLAQTGFELVLWQTYSSKPLASAIYRFVPIASKARALVRKLPASGVSA